LGLGAFTGKGWISLSDGHEMDLSLRLAPEDMGLLWDMAGRYRLPLEGILEAEVDLKGPWSGPRISGRVSARDGSIRRFAFSEIDLRFEGTGARIHFEDARVVPAEGPLFRVSGALDLADVAGLPQQLQHLRKDLVVVDDGTNRTWAFRGADDAGDGHATQLRSFVSGQDSRDEMAGVLGVQKQIGF
jgi:autotransporter translocation and assembly factor TamB